jgi:hypothetical protein
MLNEDVNDLYTRTHIGTNVVVPMTHRHIAAASHIAVASLPIAANGFAPSLR